MIKRVRPLIAWLVTGILFFFTARRWFFTGLALLADRSATTPPIQTAALPDLLLLVPVRNEAETLPGLLTALDHLRYPEDRLTLVFVDDGSTDASDLLLRSWTAIRRNHHLLRLEQNVGKAAALNVALARFPRGEIVAIYDADERPRPDALRYLAAGFCDEKTGGVSGRRAVENGLATPAAGYTTFEGLVHQLVTLRAKDRANLAPAILGSNCAYRRTALAQADYFRPGALLEDSDLTLKLVRAGWQLRFEGRAVSYHRVPETITGYWHQHTRWARGFNEVARAQASEVIRDRQLPWFLRLELLAFSLGYLDRLALMAGGGLILLGRAGRPLVPAVTVSLLTPLFQIMVALKIGRQPPAMWLRMVWVPFFFILDIAMAATGFWQTLKQTPKIWEERQARK